MYWQDEDEINSTQVPDDVVDLLFQLSGRELPCDHAWQLMGAIREILPWFGGDPSLGLHLIYPAPSGNGWYSPSDMAAETMYLPRRAKLGLRLPKAMVDAARDLEESELHVGDFKLTIGKSDIRLLSLHTTLNARHVLSAEGAESEADFLDWASDRFSAMGVTARRMVVGRTTILHRDQSKLVTRSLMLADLKPRESLQVQRQGLGDERRLGCGLFIPHKSVRNIIEEG